MYNWERNLKVLLPTGGFIKDLGKKWKNRKNSRKSAWDGARDFVLHH